MGGARGDRYLIIDRIGEGGTATVYVAHDTELDERVALKIIKEDIASRPAIVERFRREVKLARRIAHRNVARIFELGEDDEGRRFLTMELVEGLSLAQATDTDAAMSIERASRIISAICKGLEAAHEVGVIHRDIKPANILLSNEGRVVITDFGIAHALAAGDKQDKLTGAPIGTPAYMAPEQLELKPITPQTDLYALGVLAFELITGHLPWKGRNVWEQTLARLNQEPPSMLEHLPDVPDTIDNLVRDCLNPDPRKRPASAAVLRDVLMFAVFGDQPHPTPITLPELPQPKVTKPPELPKIAVLPLDYVGKADESYVAEVLTEDLSDALSRLRGLRVLARRKPDATHPADIGVDVVAEGTIRAQEDNFRISVRLIGEDGFVRWSKRFHCCRGGLLQLPDDIANAIAVELDLPTRVRVQDSSLEGEAIELYLKGRLAHYRSDFGGAIELLEKALEHAPEHPTLLAAMSLSMFRTAFVEPDSAIFEKARIAARKASEIAPDLAEPKLALAQGKLHLGDSAAAARLYRESVGLAPSLVEGHVSLADILVEVGRFEDGIKRAQLALSLDDQLNPARHIWARALALQGEYESALDLIRAARDNDGVQLYVSQFRLAAWAKSEDDIQEVVEALKTTDSLDAGPAKMMLQAYLDRDLARHLLESKMGLIGAGASLRRRAFVAQVTTELACHHDFIDHAMGAFKAADEAQLIDISWFQRCPTLAPLRERDDAQTIAERIRGRADAVVDAIWG